MSFKKPILVILLLIIICVISSPADANEKWGPKNGDSHLFFAFKKILR